MPDAAVPARLVDVRRTPAGRHVVLLAADDRELPICIGAPEAEALAAGLQDVQLPRPSTHALALAVAAGVPIEIARPVLDATRAPKPDEYAEDLASAREGAQSLADELRAQIGGAGEGARRRSARA